MTLQEYENKKSNIQSSDAHPSIKEKALEELEIKFRGDYLTQKIALEMFEDSKADIDDIGEH